MLSWEDGRFFVGLMYPVYRLACVADLGLTSGSEDWLRWRPEPTAYTDGVDEASGASEGIPERGAEDVGMERLWIAS